MKTVVSLFSGCGGLDLGFKEAGFKLLYACDNDEAAVDAYKRNLDENAYVRDVTSEEFHSDLSHIGSCDVVLGGFPCQGFSKAGPKNEQDQRNTLYVEMRNAIKTLSPTVFIAENVDGVAQNFNGSFLSKILDDFKELGYRVEHKILDAASYGVAQHRRRIFFVGIKASSHLLFTWPEPSHAAETRNGEFKVVEMLPLFQSNKNVLQPANTIQDAIGDLVELDSNVPDHAVTGAWPKDYAAIFRVIKQGQKLCNVRHAKTSVYTWEIPEVFGSVSEREILILETIGKHRRHKKYGSIPNGNPLPTDEIEQLSGLSKINKDIESLLSKDYIKEIDGKFDLKGAMFCSGIFKRPRWDETCQTVLTNFHNPRYFLHPLKDRPFSLRECARLQGFPDDFLITAPAVGLIDGYRLIGNAVAPPVSRVLGVAVMTMLSDEKTAFQSVPQVLVT